MLLEQPASKVLSTSQLSIAPYLLTSKFCFSGEFIVLNIYVFRVSGCSSLARVIAIMDSGIVKSNRVMITIK